MSYKLIIAGGSGSLGKRLIEHFSHRFEDIVVFSRGPSRNTETCRFVHWDAATQGDWVAELVTTDVLINLTGKSIQTRFTEKNKKELISSRIESTAALGTALSGLNNPEMIWLNASGAAIYGTSVDQAMDESSEQRGDNFLSKLSSQWESIFFGYSIPNVRQVALRITPVLDPDEGFLPTLVTLCKLGLGGKQGSGRQVMSWIHHEDLTRAVGYILDHKDLTGPINLSSPSPLSNADFMRTLRQSLNSWIGIPSPGFALRLGSVFSGVDPSLVLDSSNVIPKRLLDHGFVFKYEELEQALKDLISSP